ncbi:hypothetical protein [Candidatus Electronema sp. PJ]
MLFINVGEQARLFCDIGQLPQCLAEESGSFIKEFGSATEEFCRLGKEL